MTPFFIENAFYGYVKESQIQVKIMEDVKLISLALRPLQSNMKHFCSSCKF